MNESSEQTSRPDAEEYARIVIYQLAALRAELVETRNLATVALCNLKGETHAQYLARIEDQGKRVSAEIDRIYRVSLEMANIPYKDLPNTQSQT